MTRYQVHTVESAPEASRPALEKLSGELGGFLPNLAAAMATSPALITAFTTLRTLNQSSAFSAVEREVIALVTSFGNSCAYCMAAHSTFAAKAGADRSTLEALRAGDIELSDARLRSLARFTSRLLTAGGELPPEEVDRFVAAGFTEEQALDVVVTIGMTSIANHASHVMAVPVDTAFANQTWRAGTPVT